MKIFSVLFAICLLICGCKSKHDITQLSTYTHGQFLDSFEFIITPIIKVADYNTTNFDVQCSQSAISHASTLNNDTPIHAYPSFKIQGTRKRAYEESNQTTNTTTKATSSTQHTYIDIIFLVIGICIVAVFFRIAKLYS